MTPKYDSEFVLAHTKKHINRSIDKSIRFAYDRLPDFEGNQEKTAEILSTVAKLKALYVK